MKSLILFASGKGSNVQAIIDYFDNNAAIKPALIVCNKLGAGVLAIAEAQGIPVKMVDKKSIKETALLQQLQAIQPDLLVLAGFLWKIPNSIIAAFPQKIINIHPALLPNYGGKGMYGAFVHEAVKKSGDKESGITIHYVNEHYDEGNTIVQVRCRVEEQDTAGSLAEKIHQLEHFFFPRTIDFLLRQNEE